eukprot:3231926-Pyramimonas_sp.AAC.1
MEVKSGSVGGQAGVKRAILGTWRECERTRWYYLPRAHHVASALLLALLGWVKRGSRGGQEGVKRAPHCAPPSSCPSWLGQEGVKR